jgi:hypothetical protein
MEISSGRKRWGIVVGAVALLILIGVYGVAPFVGAQAKVRDDMRDKLELLAKSERVAAQKGQYQRQVEALRASLEQRQGVLYVGDKLPVAAAQIQDLLHALGQEAGITIVRENVRPPRKVEVLTEVTVELSIQGDIRQVRDFMYKIQTSPKLLVVPKVVIRSLPVRGPTGVAVELLVAGYLLGGEEKGSVSPQSSSGAGA